MSEATGSMGHEDQETEHQLGEGQVSEVGALKGSDEPITPGDATAGYPYEDAESGRPDQGTAGPNAAPRHGLTERSNESSR